VVCEKGHKDILKMLIDHKVDLTAKDNQVRHFHVVISQYSDEQFFAVVDWASFGLRRRTQRHCEGVDRPPS
jgi:hypothetical protein